MQPYDRNIPYNNLPELPPSDEKVITIEILHALNKANKALAELKGIAKKLPNQAMLVNTIALREAKASTEIENIFTTDEIQNIWQLNVPFFMILLKILILNIKIY